MRTIREPQPRKVKLGTCVIISLYSSSFLFFLMDWMAKETKYFYLKFYLTYLLCISFHFVILHKRHRLYELCCKLTNSRIRFFEFPYFVLIAIFYLFIFLIVPFLLNLIQLHTGISGIFQDRNMTMFMLFGGGAGFVVAAISGFTIYPVNTFGTKASLEHLITITRELMKFSNRLLAVITSAVIAGWVFQKVEFSLNIIYMTLYGILGFALGGTAVLGSRVTELLYMLSEIEKKDKN